MKLAKVYLKLIARHLDTDIDTVSKMIEDEDIEIKSDVAGFVYDELFDRLSYKDCKEEIISLLGRSGLSFSEDTIALSLATEMSDDVVILNKGLIAVIK